MSPIRMSRLEFAMRVVLQFHEAFNCADITALQAIIAEDCILETSHPAPEGMTYKGREAIAGYWKDFFYSSSQVHSDIEDIFGSGSHCVMRWTRHWVDHEQEARSLRGADIFLVREDRIVEIFSYTKS